MVSIIMPTYNRAYIIERAIHSVQQQTYEDWELIIVDDGSTDDTQRLLQKYASSKIRYYINNKNRGANVSRNIGVSEANGEFLAFLDSDNYWPDNKLEIQMKRLEECWNEKCFLYGKTQITNGDEVRVVPTEILSNIDLKAIELKENVVDLNTILIKKSIFMEAGGFDEELPRLQDWELVLRFLYCFEMEGIACKEILSFNEIQENSISRNTTYFLEALGVLIRKYFLHHLSLDKIIDYLNFIWHYGESEKELIYKVITEIGKDNPAILYRIIEQNLEFKERLQISQEKLQISHRMEVLLYNWQKKREENEGKSAFWGYFNSRTDIHDIAIYGLGKIGMLFYNEIKYLPVNIQYGIDRKKDGIVGLKIRHSMEGLRKVDLMIITLVKDDEEIKKQLKNNYDGEIITIFELLQTI